MSKFKTVDEYIASFPEEVQKVLQTIRQTIKEVLPDSEEVISYNIPAFITQGERVIYFSGWKKHTSLYPFTDAMEKEFSETSEYNTSGKGTIQFPLDKPLPLDLIRKIVKFRVREMQEK
jgi:uncharacterized protein YdhG (YjbR/CyaY superfamily)